MKIKSVSSLTLYVNDLQKSAAFYESLGFDKRKDTETTSTLYSNWFSITFVDQAKAAFTQDQNIENKGEGVFIYLAVDNVDEAYKEILTMGYKPSSEPKDWPWGNREFVLRDPDGYKLVLFKKK